MRLQTLREFLSYNAIGIINTFIGFSLIFILMYLGMSAEKSNAIGYGIGAIVSYFLNSKYTFKQQGYSPIHMVKFFAILVIAYMLNVIVLQILLPVMNAYIAQIFSAIVYTISAFILAKYVVFKKA